MRNGHRIGPLDESHVAEVTTLHLHAFPTSALTALGPHVVRSYYAWLFTGPHDRCVVGVWENEVLVGFCFAGRFRGATAGFLRRHRLPLAAALLARPWLLARREFRARLGLGLGILRRFWRTSPGETRDGAAAASAWGVLSVAVDPRFQGAGCGRAMLDAVETAAAAAGVATLHLTVEPDNLTAVQFYDRLGWRRMPATGAWAGKMAKTLECFTARDHGLAR